MKKVLIIANLPSASPRMSSLAKYLPEFGWQPIILTTPIDEKPYSNFARARGPTNDFKSSNVIIETGGYRSRDIRTYTKEHNFDSNRLYTKVKPLLRFLYKYYLEFICYPDSEKGWKTFAVKAGNKLLQKEEINALISSWPVTPHIIARELKNRHKIPWIADFQDLWTQNHNYPYTRLRKMFEKRLELKTLSMTDAIVTCASLATEKMRKLHKGKNIYTITNGFDPEKISDRKTRLTSKFTITYTGQIYKKKQDPSKLLIALKDLISHGIISPRDLEVRFYGPENKILMENIKEYGLSDVVRIYGIIPIETSLAKQRESQALLLLNWEDPMIKEVYTGKIFEYLAAQRPILATGGFGNDVVEALLNETSSGVYCSKIEDIKNTLQKMYSEYKLKGKISYYGNIEKINKYSYREMARNFAEILDNLT